MTQLKLPPENPGRFTRYVWVEPPLLEARSRPVRLEMSSIDHQPIGLTTLSAASSAKMRLNTPRRFQRMKQS